jgi:glycosyltransferase involved in cell wall biosynthesis
MKRFPISVMHFTNSVVRGGAEEHILTLLRNLDRSYFRLHLVCPGECAESLEADLPADVRLIRMSFEAPHQPGAAIRFAQLVRELRIEILHSHLFSASMAASPIGWMCGVPVVVETPHVREAWRQGVLKRTRVVDRMIGRFVNRFIAVSEANVRYLIEEKRLPARKISMIHNGCDLRKFYPGTSDPLEMRRKFGLSEDGPMLLVIGRLEPQKGHRFCLEAFRGVLREFPEAQLVCVGEGSLRRELAQLAAQFEIDRAVRFVGHQANVNDWLAMCDVSILPSLYEGLPLAAIESLAARRPLVATRVDGTPEVVVHEKTGLLVPPGDSQELAGALLRLLRNPELGRRLARAGRECVAKRFSQEQQIQKTQELYLREWNLAVAGAGSPACAGAFSIKKAVDFRDPGGYSLPLEKN